MTRSVAIVQRCVPDYAGAMLSRLNKRLATENVHLTVFAGAALPHERFKDGLDALPSKIRVRNFYFGNRVYWQNIYPQLRHYDLVIVEQANGALLNYVLLAGRWLRGLPRRIAFWGHGINFQAKNPQPLRSALKRMLIGAADHWFAYTQITADIVSAANYPASRITVINNSVDVSGLSAAAEEVARIGRAAARKKLNIESGHVAVFCSRLYDDKKLDVLFAAASLVRERIADFRLIVIGDGPLRPELDAFAASNPWVSAMGALYGERRNAYIAAADAMVMPAAVGLTILDAFAAGIPLVTADYGNHGPEIAYLDNGRNGLLTAPGPQAYASAIAELLGDPPRLQAMSAAALESAARYSLDQMIERFAAGVMQALARD